MVVDNKSAKFVIVILFLEQSMSYTYENNFVQTLKAV